MYRKLETNERTRKVEAIEMPYPNNIIRPAVLTAQDRLTIAMTENEMTK